MKIKCNRSALMGVIVVMTLLSCLLVSDTPVTLRSIGGVPLNLRRLASCGSLDVAMARVHLVDATDKNSFASLDDFIARGGDSGQGSTARPYSHDCNLSKSIIDEEIHGAGKDNDAQMKISDRMPSATNIESFLHYFQFFSTYKEMYLCMILGSVLPVILMSFVGVASAGSRKRFSILFRTLAKPTRSTLPFLYISCSLPLALPREESPVRRKSSALEKQAIRQPFEIESTVAVPPRHEINTRRLVSEIWERPWEELGQGEMGQDLTPTVALSADGKSLIGGFYRLNNGVARVYTLDDNDTWTQAGPDIAGDASNQKLGQSVAISSDGSIIAVGIPGYDGSKGAVRVYAYTKNGQGVGSSASWVQMGSDFLGTVSYELLGTAISLSHDGNTIVIGSIKKGACVYKWVTDSWSKLGQSLTGPDNLRFGNDVSISSNGERIAAASPGNNNVGGFVNIYDWDSSNDTWVQVGQMTGDAATDFGRAISLSADGTKVAIGVPKHNVDFGMVQVHEWTGDSWSQMGQNIVGEPLWEYTPNYGYQLGYDVSITSSSNDGTSLAIASQCTRSTQCPKGIAHVYKWDGSSWVRNAVDMYRYSTWGQVSIGADGEVVAVVGSQTPIKVFKRPPPTPSISPSVSIIPSSSILPSEAPTELPTHSPSVSILPTPFPTVSPTLSPSHVPSNLPSLQPSFMPSDMPSNYPSNYPSVVPTISKMPSVAPTSVPSLVPSSMPSLSFDPTTSPSSAPSETPSEVPSSAPSIEPPYVDVGAIDWSANKGGCVAWRQTGNCDPDGPRESDQDKSCTDTIPGSSSGFCECEGPSVKFTCGHDDLTCETKCAESAYDSVLWDIDGTLIDTENWISFDLTQKFTLTAVQINWGAPPSGEYTVQVSDDKEVWTTVLTTTTTAVGVVKLSVPGGASGRYVAINCKDSTARYFMYKESTRVLARQWLSVDISTILTKVESIETTLANSISSIGETSDTKDVLQEIDDNVIKLLNTSQHIESSLDEVEALVNSLEPKIDLLSGIASNVNLLSGINANVSNVFDQVNEINSSVDSLELAVSSINLTIVNDLKPNVEKLPVIETKVDSVASDTNEIIKAVNRTESVAEVINKTLEKVEADVGLLQDSTNVILDTVKSIEAAVKAASLEVSVKVNSGDNDYKSIMVFVTVEGIPIDADANPELFMFDGSSLITIAPGISNNFSTGAYHIEFQGVGTNVFWTKVSVGGSEYERTIMFDA